MHIAIDNNVVDLLDAASCLTSFIDNIFIDVVDGV